MKMSKTTTRRGRIRRASPADEDALYQLEWVSFTSDRFDRRQIRHLLTRANATTWIAQRGNQIQGAAIMLWREGTEVGHLYSIVVHPAHRGRGIGKRLIAVCEREARRRGCGRMALEVREDNRRARRFYERLGYHTVERLPAYYQDGTDGLRMVKPLAPGEAAAPQGRWADEKSAGLLLDVPYYAQSLEFTCGPACLMMAMKYLDPEMTLGRALELLLWKEATLIYMTSGLGGSDPFGLALAARRRGFRTTVMTSDGRTPFLSSVRKPEKRTVIRLVHHELRRQALELGIPVQHSVFPVDEMVTALRRHLVPIVLISTYRLHGTRAPHWVTVTGLDDAHIYFHDPYEGFYRRNNRCATHVKVPIREFTRMRRYGRHMQRIAVLIGPRKGA